MPTLPLLPSSRAFLAGLALIGLAFFWGCGKPAHPGLLPEYQPAQLFGEQLDDDLATGGSLEPYGESARSFAVIEKDAVSELMRVAIEELDQESWRIELGEQRASVVRREDGRLALLETTDYPNNAVTTFDPPLLLIEKGMSEGKGVESQHQVVVRALDDDSKIVDRGTAEQTLVREADQTLLLPDGRSHRAVRLRRTLRLALGRATVEEVTTSWYVPELGLAAEQSREQVKVFGPLGWTKERLLVRVP